LATLAVTVMTAAAVTIFAVPSLGQSVNPTTYDLGPQGEVSHWLMLGYFPLTVQVPTYGSVLDADLLSDAGGEAKLQPVGGQKVTLATTKIIPKAADLVWQHAAMHAPLMGGGWNTHVRLHLFVDAKGQPLEYTGCYLYTEIVSPAPFDGQFLVGSDDSVKMILNGKVLHRFAGQRASNPGSDEVPVHLDKGVNRLMVRVDNYVGDGGLFCRLVDAHGAPADSVKLQIVVPPGATEANTGPNPDESWEKVRSYIPALKPAEHEEFFGGRLNHVMGLLESGAVTHRPVRIVFYGQSITAQEWTNMLVARLRERYPRTQIIAENHALGGWGIWLLVRAMRHDILRVQPDLICLHAYAGSPDEWERSLQTIRKETCADIMIRTAHISEWDAKNLGDVVNDETLMLRGLAQKYSVELVDARREWIDFVQGNKLQFKDLLMDPIHLNHKGCALMAQLYERHLRFNPLYPCGRMDSVRYYSANRPLDEHRFDEITLEGKGWKSASGVAQYIGGPGCKLHLWFTGNRVDLILGSDLAGASVLIDDAPPSMLHRYNLYHGLRPFQTIGSMAPPASIVQYFIGPKMQVETWELTFKDISPDGKKFRFNLRGSVTGEDGEGSNTEEFVSRSGRITIEPNDWLPAWHYPPENIAQLPAPKLTWQIVADFRDQVKCGPVPKDWPQNQPYRQYVTVADGLPPGEHELTVVPDPKASFSIQGVDAYNPPLAGK
jgi:hypothetical protein